eukprot:Gb_17367 [translate_table: standard]
MHDANPGAVSQEDWDKMNEKSIALIGLPDSWDNLIVAISGSTKIVDLKMEVIVSQLLQEETRRRMAEPVRNVDGLSRKGRSRDRRNNELGVKEQRSKSRRKFPSKRRNQDLICWKCNLKGHKKSECKADVSEEKAKSSTTSTTSVEGSVGLETSLTSDA